MADITDMTDQSGLADLTDAGKREQQQMELIYEELGLTRFEDAKAPAGLWSAVKPGQDLVIAGYIGLGGTVWMARHKGDILRKTLPEDYVESGKALLAELEQVSAFTGFNAAAVYPVIQGGIFAALWEFAQAAGTGIHTRLTDIPVRQQTIEFCEVFDLNPYQLLSGGCTLIAADNGCDLLYRMNRAGIPCAVIGKVTKDHDRVVAHDDTCRYLTRPQRDEIFELL